VVELHSEPVEIPKNLKRFIYITGCDGTGKTTQAHLLLEQLKAAGVKTRHVWLRFPFLFSLPLLAYARWRGMSWYEQTGNIRHGYWDFSRSRLLASFLPWLLLLDASLAGFTKIWLPIWHHETVICERFVLDMLVDLCLAFRKKDLFNDLPGRLYLKLLPRNARIFILDLDADTIRNRRVDLRADRRLQARLDIYNRLSKDLSLRMYSSRLPAHIVNELIIKTVLA